MVADKQNSLNTMKSKINKQSQVVDTHLQPQGTVADEVADGPDSSATTFDAILDRMKRATGAKSDTAFAKLLGLSQSSISGAKERQSVPPAWAVQIAEKFDVSLDWLMFGQERQYRDGDVCFCGSSATMKEGEEIAQVVAAKLRGEIPSKFGAIAQHPGRMSRATCDNTSAHNDSARRDISIADMLAKTAKVLESDTVYREALYSNIEAFHHGVTMDERVNKMGQQFAQVMESFQAQLDQIHAENQQLRKDLEDSRSQSAVRDTG